MGIEVRFLGGFLMAWPKLCCERRGKVSGRSEIVLVHEMIGYIKVQGSNKESGTCL